MGEHARPAPYHDPAVAAAYREARALPDDVLAVWADALRKLLPDARPRIVVDLGCGTGRFTTMLARTFAVAVLGLDPAPAMLRECRAAGAGVLTAARAETLPLRDGSVDLVFLSMVYHHLDAARAVPELARVVRPGGHVVVRNATRDILDGFEYKRFFPETRALDEARMPSRAGLVAAFGGSGFEPAGHRCVQHRIAPGYEAYLDKISRRVFSDLQALPDDLFAARLAAFSAHCRARAAAADGPIDEPVDLFAFRRRA